MSHSTSVCADALSAVDSCSRCDLLLGLDGAHVERVDRRAGLLTVTVSSPPAVTGRPSCGVIAVGRGRRRRVLHDVPGVTRVQIVWWAVEPELVRLAGDESRFHGVTTLGVDEHVWHHVDPRKRGPNELTGMVDLTRGPQGGHGRGYWIWCQAGRGTPTRPGLTRAGAENLTDRQRARLAAAIEANPAHGEVFVAWQCAQELRSAYHLKDLLDGRRIAKKVVGSFSSCRMPEIARLGRTLDVSASLQE
ncbi:transposase [Micrococcales bacterium 31B]|nr:transposase [Micrococcales bacterium 31B]